MTIQEIFEEGLGRVNSLIMGSSFYAEPHTGHAVTLIAKELPEKDIQLLFQLMQATILNPVDNDAAYWVSLMAEGRPFWFADLLDMYLPLRMGTSYPRGINRIELIEVSENAGHHVLTLVFWTGETLNRGDLSDLKNTGVASTLDLAKKLIQAATLNSKHWAQLQRASCKALLYADWLTFKEDPYSISLDKIVPLLLGGIKDAMRGDPILASIVLEYTMGISAYALVVDPLLETLKTINRIVGEPPATTEGLYLLGAQVSTKPVSTFVLCQDSFYISLAQPILSGTLDAESPWIGLDTLLKYRSLDIKGYGMRDLEMVEKEGRFVVNLTLVLVVKEK